MIVESYLKGEKNSYNLPKCRKTHLIHLHQVGFVK